jgi:hypothetical protein
MLVCSSWVTDCEVWTPIKLNQRLSIGICCFSKKLYAALRSKSKNQLPRNQNNVFKWSEMSTHRRLFKSVCTIKIQLSVVINWMWSSTQRGHQLNVVINSVWSSTERGHQLSVVINWAWSSTEHGHQLSMVINWAWSSTECGHQLSMIINSAWSSTQHGHQLSVVIIRS